MAFGLLEYEKNRFILSEHPSSQTLLLDSIVQINENSESITKEIQSEELIFYFGNTDRADDAWFTESDLLADFAKQHPDMRFALANAVVEYLDEKQHTERNLKDLHAAVQKDQLYD